CEARSRDEGWIARRTRRARTQQDRGDRARAGAVGPKAAFRGILRRPMNVPVLTSRIDSVTVYRQGALVCRSAVLLAAQPVPTQVRLLGLPLSLDDGSVRVRVEGED